MKRFKRLAALFLAIFTAAALFGCQGAKNGQTDGTDDSASSETESTEEKELVYPEKTDGMFTMKALEDWAKFNGRYYFSGKTGMTFDWSSSGFSVNAETEDTDFTVFIRAGYDLYVSVYVDGAEAARPLVKKEDASFSVPLTKGTHTVTIYKDTEVNTSGSADLLGIDFEGTLLPPPENKKLYIEFYGASYETGQGALGTFVQGEAWSLPDHSATHSHCHYLAQKLDADYSIVAKGGIGAVKDAGGYNLPDLFPYVVGYREQLTRYSFERKPDLVIIQLGGNDGSSDLIGYGNACENFLTNVRAQYGKEVPILWLGRDQGRQDAVKKAANKLGDTNFYYLTYEVKGLGSAALKTQTKGHPNAEEQENIANTVEKFIWENKLLEK